MNFHYIDYMIRERRREELETSERLRLLNSAGNSQTVLMRKACGGLINTVRRLINQSSMVKALARASEEGL